MGFLGKVTKGVSGLVKKAGGTVNKGIGKAMHPMKKGGVGPSNDVMSKLSGAMKRK